MRMESWMRDLKELMTRLSKKNGWFAPVSDVLDHLMKINGKIFRERRNVLMNCDGCFQKPLMDRASYIVN